MALARKNARSGTKSDVEAKDIEAELAQLRKDISSLTHTVSAFGATKAGKIAANAAGKKDELDANGAQLLDDAQEHISNFENEIKEHIRQNPLQAVGIAAGVGFVVAALSRLGQ